MFLTFCVDCYVISIVNQMMLVNIPRHQELKRNARSLITIRNAVVRLAAAAESHHQVRVVSFSFAKFFLVTPLTLDVNVLLRYNPEFQNRIPEMGTYPYLDLFLNPTWQCFCLAPKFFKIITSASTAHGATIVL